MKYLTLIMMVILAIPVNAVYINQIFYDSEGDDSGNEFIELGSNVTTSLEDYNLYYSRGLEGDDWDLIWQGSGTILENDYVTIGDYNVDSDFNVSLNMGNTKGALKLTNNISEDLVGYGDADYFQGSPAVDVTYDNSLQRITQTNNNGVDFIEATPALHSTSLKESFTITIKEVIPDLEIVGISSIEAFAGEEVDLEVSLSSSGNYTIEIAGSLTNGVDIININSFTTNVNGNDVVKIPLELPETLTAGNYTGRLAILVE